MKKLEMVKKLAQEGKIQRALNKLSDIVYTPCNTELIEDAFMSKYQTGDMILQMFEDLDENSVEMELNEYYEMYDLEDGTTMAIEITTESIMKIVEEMERLLKVA